VIPVMIVPVLARPELLYRMIDSIDHAIGQLVIIDNGRVVDPQQVLTPYALTTHLLPMPANFGVAGSWNLGIKSTPFAAWWLIANFDVVWPAGSLERLAQASSSQALTLTACQPAWSAFTVGDRVIDAVGLFDEAFHPAYFEDNDYLRRCEKAGVHIERTEISVRHDNSSTLGAGGFAARNGHTFPANAEHFQDKVEAGDYSEGRWTLARRRRLSWD
jgi:GT2 family glycosyltransferase